MANFPEFTPADRAADIALLGRLQERLLARVSELLDGTRDVALIDYPNNSNVGDSLIWLGALQLVRRLGLRVHYISDCHNTDFERLRRLACKHRLALLLNGGGNFGSLWLHHQLFRLKVFESFPDNTIIQLPVSTHFDDLDGELARRTRDVLARRPNVHLLVRDQPSVEQFQRHFGVSASLVPDLAFMIGALERKPARHPVIALLRSDKEKRIGQTLSVGPEVPVVDWLEEGLQERFWQRLISSGGKSLEAFDGNHRVLGWLWEQLSRARLRRGIALLSRGESVVTDRLHAHVLSVLLGIPNSIGDNSTGKVHALFDAWTGECRCARWRGAAPAAVSSPIDPTMTPTTVLNSQT
ncbi:polysaccharide pyruvyl transferase family protein [Derxia gummosa]|uniref:Polysaccharide pyruvyl transferase family protein n=1 Tax=Derxia gummosa DSM 723 TaxID=1121388 RepID=A0A8B6X623_9BURK|nr:polysaccharide pyruvyl transferase family protein [Derxia gummosa]